MQMTIFLTYATQAEEAAKLYTSIIKNSKITKTVHSPLDGKVLTVEFEMGGRPFVALNAGVDFKFTEGISIAVSCETQKEVDEYSDKLIAGGGSQKDCGWLQDKFGVCWQVFPTALIDYIGGKDREKASRVMQAMMKMQRIDLAKIEKAAQG